MPWARSTLASVAQSLHTMQCVRLDTGGARRGKLGARAPSCGESPVSSEDAVKSWHPVRRCRPISKPSLWYWATWASVIGVLVYMYADARAHSQSATEQPEGLEAFSRLK